MPASWRRIIIVEYYDTKNQIMVRRFFGALHEILLELLPNRCLVPSVPVVTQMADGCWDARFNRVLTYGAGGALQRQISNAHVY